MSGTGSRFRLPTSIMLFLWFLVCSLMVHFVVDDLTLRPCPIAAAGGIQCSDELTHQDDLAFTAALPVCVPVSQSCFCAPALPATQTRVYFLVRLPPKI
jgi:hypothetical protein